MKFTQFTTNGWVDDTCKYVIVANPDTHKFQVRFYKDGFSTTNLLLGKNNESVIIGEDFDSDSDATAAADNHYKNSMKVEAFKEYMDDKSKDQDAKLVKQTLIDIAHLILERFETK